MIILFAFHSTPNLPQPRLPLSPTFFQSATISERDDDDDDEVKLSVSACVMLVEENDFILVLFKAMPFLQLLKHGLLILFFG